MSALVFAIGVLFYAAIVACLTDCLDVGTGRIGKWAKQANREPNWKFGVNNLTQAAQ